MDQKIRLGIAPIGWTNDDMPELGGDITFEQCIREMAEAGYQGSEVGNKYPRDPAALKAALAPHGLSIASQWFSAFFTMGKKKETVDAFKKHMAFLKAMGSKVIVISEQGHSIQGQVDTPLFDKKPVLDEKGWGLLVDGLHEIGKLAKKESMKIVYHHHMGTIVQTEEEVATLMEKTNPDLVYLLLDTGHIYFSGGKPLTLLKKHGARVAHVHLKDIRDSVRERVIKEKWSFLKAVREGVFTVPGDGAIDFKPVFKELDKLKYEGWFVVEAEQDPVKANPLVYAKKAREYIKKQTGL